jgi:hypothetical protein
MSISESAYRRVERIIKAETKNLDKEMEKFRDLTRDMDYFDDQSESEPEWPREPDSWQTTESLAIRLKNLYSGFERIFQRIVREIDNEPIDTDENNWHQKLLQTVRSPHENRPAVLENDVNYEILTELRRFRHHVRKNYPHDFEWELMKDGVAHYQQIREQTLEDIQVFMEKIKPSDVEQE